MKIIDLTEDDKQQEAMPKNKIELVSCLQSDLNYEGYHYFYNGSGYEWALKNANKVRRLVKNPAQKELDLIQVDRQIFLGRWNDGVGYPNNEVIDECGEQKAKIPIELISCLQESPDHRTGDNYFYKMSGFYGLKNAYSVTRVCRDVSNTGYDMIIVENSSGNKEGWLGHWNDGVVN